MMCGEIWWVDFGIPFGSEPGYRHPALIVQSDFLNESNLNTTIVMPITSNLTLADYQGNYLLKKESTGLSKDSVVIGAQIIVIDKERLLEKAGEINSFLFANVLEEFYSILG